MTPLRLFMIVLIAGAIVAFTVPTAQAAYYITKPRAQSFARSEFLDRYGNPDGYLAVVCRPQGLRAAKRGYIYHRWACTWADDSAWGVFLIAGSDRGEAWYHVQLLKGLTALSFRQ